MARVSVSHMVAGLAAFAALACGEPKAEIVVESTAATPPAEESPAVSWTGSWAPVLGDLVVVPADTDNTAIVLFPDDPPASLLAAGRLMLIGAAGDTVGASVSARSADSLECGGAPVVGLAAPPSGTWVVGLGAGVPILRSDSIEALAPRDSARLVVGLARLASTIAANDETRFTGLPFAVVRARLFTIRTTRLVAAHLVRKLPQEASPLEEHTLVIADRPVEGDSLALRFSQRSEGTEETADHFDVLSGVQSGGTVLLLLARDNVSGTTYQVLERNAAGTWRVRWTRALRC